MDDGYHIIAAQATDQTGAKGNVATFVFRLLTVPPGSSGGACPRHDHRLGNPGRQHHPGQQRAKRRQRLANPRCAGERHRFGGDPGAGSLVILVAPGPECRAGQWYADLDDQLPGPGAGHQPQCDDRRAGTRPLGNVMSFAKPADLTITLTGPDGTVINIPAPYTNNVV